MNSFEMRWIIVRNQSERLPGDILCDSIGGVLTDKLQRLQYRFMIGGKWSEWENVKIGSVSC